MAKESREVRFVTLKDWYIFYSQGMFDIKQVKEFVEKTGHRLYESELEKFSQSFPDINIDNFKQFLIDVQALKKAGRKAPVGSGTGREHTIKMNTPEKAAQVGVAPEDFDEYLLYITTIYEAKALLQKICKKGVVSFAIPVKKDKLVAPVETASA